MLGSTVVSDCVWFCRAGPFVFEKEQGQESTTCIPASDDQSFRRRAGGRAGSPVYELKSRVEGAARRKVGRVEGAARRKVGRVEPPQGFRFNVKLVLNQII